MENLNSAGQIKPNKKSINFIVSVIILLLVVGGTLYYFWPRSGNSGLPKSFTNLEVVRTDLTEEEINKKTELFNMDAKNLTGESAVDFWYLLEMAQIKKDFGDYYGAEEILIKAGEDNPENSTSFGNLADLYANFIKDYPKATQAYQVAIANSINDSFGVNFVRNFHDFARYSIGNSEMAEIILLDGIKGRPENSELHALLASFYKETGDKIKALEYYQKAYKLNPDNYLLKEEIDKLK